MELTTQCPQCGETFQASLEQLQLRKGYVRCISCAHIFDGYEAVVPAISGHGGMDAARAGYASHTFGADADQEPPDADEPHVPFSTQAAAPSDAGYRREPYRVHVGDEDAGVAAMQPGRRDPVLKDEDDSDDEGDGGPGRIYVEPRSPYGSARASDIPEFLDEGPRRFARMGHTLWVWLSLLALALLAAQAAYVYRVQLADSVPELRPVLERLCHPWGCTVEYPRRIEQISVLGSSLRVRKAGEEKPEQGSRLMLHVTLRNAAERPQQWPSIALDLTDFSGAVVVRKILQPSDYLPKDRLPQPFAARSELAVQLPLDVRGGDVNGYQLSLFFP